jgi:hypothetical protein
VLSSNGTGTCERAVLGENQIENGVSRLAQKGIQWKVPKKEASVAKLSKNHFIVLLLSSNHCELKGGQSTTEPSTAAGHSPDHLDNIS